MIRVIKVTLFVTTTKINMTKNLGVCIFSCTQLAVLFTFFKASVSCVLPIAVNSVSARGETRQSRLTHYLNILMSALSGALALVERSAITLSAIVLLIEF